MEGEEYLLEYSILPPTGGVVWVFLDARHSFLLFFLPYVLILLPRCSRTQQLQIKGLGNLGSNKNQCYPQGPPSFFTRLVFYAVQ